MRWKKQRVRGSVESRAHGQSKRNVDVRHASCVQVVRGGLTNDTYLCSTGWVTWEACVKLFLGRFGALYPYSPAFFLRFFPFLRFLSCCFQANESTCHDSPPCHHVHRIAANWFERVGRTRNPRYEHRNWSILAVRLAFISRLWTVAHLTRLRSKETVRNDCVICIRDFNGLLCIRLPIVDIFVACRRQKFDRFSLRFYYFVESKESREYQTIQMVKTIGSWHIATRLRLPMWADRLGLEAICHSDHVKL